MFCYGGRSIPQVDNFQLLFHLLITLKFKLNPLSANSQNAQTHSNNSLAVADKLFECVWLFCVFALKGLRHQKPLVWVQNLLHLQLRL